MMAANRYEVATRLPVKGTLLPHSLQWLATSTIHTHILHNSSYLVKLPCKSASIPFEYSPLFFHRQLLFFFFVQNSVKGIAGLIVMCNMVSEAEAAAPVVENVNNMVEEETSTKRSSPVKKNHGKVPKRVRKAEREKMKREQLNELFLDLANALDLTEQNNGKASILCEATRLLKDFFGQIESLKKENASLLSETHYVTVEKNDIEEENSALEAEIEKLQSEIEARAAQSRQDLNVHFELHRQEQTINFPGESLQFSTIKSPLQQGPAVLVVPFHPDAAEIIPKATSIVSKPQARYPTPGDSWPSQLLGEELTSS